MRRPVSVLLAAAVLTPLASALSGCPGTIEDSSRFQGSCREAIDVPTAIFVARCGDSICHDAQNPSAELDLVSPNAERRLVGVRSTQCPSRLRIDRADPDQSFLLEKLERDDPECGDRMPVGEPLTRDQIACVREWVEEAAARTSDDAAAPPPDTGAGGG